MRPQTCLGGTTTIKLSKNRTGAAYTKPMRGSEEPTNSQGACYQQTVLFFSHMPFNFSSCETGLNCETNQMCLMHIVDVSPSADVCEKPQSTCTNCNHHILIIHGSLYSVIIIRKTKVFIVYTTYTATEQHFD